MAHRNPILAWLTGAVAVLCTGQAAPLRWSPAQGGHWPRTPHEWVSGVAVTGHLAYVCVVHGMRVVDNSDPAHPLEIGLYHSPERYQYLVQVQGNYAYLAYTADESDSGLEVLDISNPAQPVKVGEYTFSEDDFPKALELKGNYAYLISYYTGLQVIDVRNPAQPVRVASYTDGVLGSCCMSDISVQEDHAYVLGYRHLAVLEIHNATNFVEVGAYTNVLTGSIRLQGHLAYVASGYHGGLQVLDVNNPAQPMLVGSCCTNGEANFVEVSGNYAFLSGSGLQVVDISDPAHPFEVAHLDDNNFNRGLALADNHVYLAGDTLQIVDVSLPVAPFRSGVFDIRGYGLNLRLSGHYAYVADQAGGLKVIDVREPANPLLVGAGFTNGNASTIDVQGHYAYVGGSQWNSINGIFEVIDIADPAQPRTVGRLVTGGPVEDLSVQGNHVYVGMSWPGGMMVVDVSNPAQPQAIFGMSGSVSSMQAAGDYLYMASSRLGILDIRDPGNPIQVSSIRGYFYDLAVSGHYAYLVADPEGSDSFQIFDVMDPAHPVQVASTYTLGYPHSIHVAGHLAYITFGGDNGPIGWAVHDVSDPADPRLVHVEYDPNPRAFQVYEGLLYTAQGEEGLGIIPSIKDVQFSFRIDGTAGLPLTIEVATNLSLPQPWTPLSTNNPPSLPFHVMDTQFRSEPQKFYRARQP